MPNTISQSTAISWITAWRANPDDKVKAFFIPVDDLTNLMLDENCIGVRAYLAFGNEVGAPEAKLLLVDVEGDISKGGTDNLSNGIYDFTKPCPSFCDVSSPLYTAIDDGSNPPLGDNRISLTDAVNWIKAWRENPDLGVKAFFIPKDDITNLLKDGDCVGVRAYLAFGNDGEDPTESKLLLVNVNEDSTGVSKDVIMNGIYDFTKPCPSFCDADSPLNTLN
ncbi:MAG: hypothetical protein JNJ52_00980 [Flavobacterium sp.]|nr:hypothetical protein [Flavobacterium sp.]